MAIRISSNNFKFNRLKFYLTDIKLGAYYRMWKTRIYKYGNFQVDSKIRILDVGCGDGYFLRCLKRWFSNAEIYGIDIDEQRLKLASQRVNGIKLIQHDAHILPFSDEYLNIITALQLIEHLKKPEDFFREANRVLKKNGLLIIATPNPSGLPAKFLKQKWSGFNPDHISLKDPLSWNAIQKKYGFHILEEGTTGLTGFRILRIFPFALINWIPMATFGFFPWYKGESYMVIAKKRNE